MMVGKLHSFWDRNFFRCYVKLLGSTYYQFDHLSSTRIRYLKWRNPHLCKLYGYGLCKGNPSHQKQPEIRFRKPSIFGSLVTFGEVTCVDGSPVGNPAPVEGQVVFPLFTRFYDHPRWFFGISEPSFQYHTSFLVQAPRPQGACSIDR